MEHRETGTDNMEEQMKIAHRVKAEYAREWRRRNPEKNKEYIRRYWLKKAAMAEEESGAQE